MYSRKNLPKIKDGVYVINLDVYNSIGTLYINSDNVKYFDSFGVEHSPKEVEKFIGNKDITTNVFRIQAYDSVCG